MKCLLGRQPPLRLAPSDDLLGVLPLAYLYVGRTHGDLAFLERTFMGADSSSWVLAVVLAAAIMTALMTEPGCSVLSAGYSPRAWGSNQAAAAGSPRLLQIVDVGSGRFRA